MSPVVPTAAARERLVEHDAARDLLRVEQFPSAALASLRRTGAVDLVDKQSCDAFIDSVVVRFDHAQFAFVTELNEPLFGDGTPQLGVKHGRGCYSAWLKLAVSV